MCKDNAPKSWTTTTSWELKIKDITWLFDDGNPRFRHERWRDVFEKQLVNTPSGTAVTNQLFSLPLGEDSVSFTIWHSEQAIWKRYCTLSQLAVLGEKELEARHRLESRNRILRLI